MRRLVFALVTASLATPVPATAAAGRMTGPRETLIARDRQIREILGDRDRTLSAGEAFRLRALVNGIFDYETHARESFGKHWEEMNERDRAEGVHLVTTLLERSSMEKVHEYRETAIEYVSERFDTSSPEVATVVTRVTRNREAWEVGYRMRLAGGRWRIVDVLVEGAGTIDNNRTTFYKQIRALGIGGLLAKLRKKAEQK